jgi:hypothetical protein
MMLKQVDKVKRGDSGGISGGIARAPNLKVLPPCVEVVPPWSWHSTAVAAFLSPVIAPPLPRPCNPVVEHAMGPWTSL